MDDYEEEDLVECDNCGISLDDCDVWDLHSNNYCQDCYYNLLGEEEEEINYTGPNCDSNGNCDECGKSRIYNQCTCY